MRNAILTFAALALLCNAAWASFVFEANYTGAANYNETRLNITGPISLAYRDSLIYVGDSEAEGIIIVNSSDAAEGNIGVRGPFSALVQQPSRMVFDGNYLYIADKALGVVQRYDLVGKNLEAVAVNARERKRPAAVDVYQGKIYVLDGENDQVLSYNQTQNTLIKTMLWRGFGSTGISGATDIEVYDGKMYISDSENDRIAVFDLDGNYIDSWGRGRGNVSLFRPGGIDVYNGRLYVADSLNNRVVVFGPDSYPIETISKWGEGETDSFSKPLDVVVGNGKLYVADYNNKRVVAFRINESGSAAAQGQIARAEKAVTDAEAVFKLLGDAGGVPPAWDLPARLASAKAKYQSSEYGNALELTSSIIDDAQKYKASATQTLKISIQQRIDSATSELAGQANTTKNATVQAERKRIEGLISDAKSKLDAGDYQASIAAIKSAEAALSQFGKLAAEASKPKAQPEKKQDNASAQKNGLEDEGTRLLARLDALASSQANYSYNKDYSILRSLISSGMALAQDGMISQANATLSTAIAQISVEEGLWQQTLRAMQNASAGIGRAKKAVEDASNVGADTGNAKAKLDEAEKMLAQDPAKATALASEAEKLAQAEGEKGKARALAFATLAAALAGVVIAGTAAYWLFKSRRRGV